MSESPTTACPGCSATVAADAKFCSHCGCLLGGGIATPQGRSAKWYHNIWFVLFMLFFVLGPFGLGLVWSNPRFSRGIKIALTLVMVVYTVVLVGMTIRTTQVVIEHINQNNAVFSF